MPKWLYGPGLALSIAALSYLMTAFFRGVGGAPKVVWTGVLGWALLSALLNGWYLFYIVPGFARLAGEADVAVLPLFGWDPTSANVQLAVWLNLAEYTFAVGSAFLAARLTCTCSRRRKS